MRNTSVSSDAIMYAVVNVIFPIALHCRDNDGASRKFPVFGFDVPEYVYFKTIRCYGSLSPHPQTVLVVPLIIVAILVTLK